MILVWLLRTPTPATERLHQRCTYFLDMARTGKVNVVVPAPALSEFLAGVPQADHPGFLSKIAKYFDIAPFDAKASAIAADIWIRHRGLPAEQQIARSILKVDVMVVAAARAFGARRFVSNDAKCRKLAEYVMTAEDLPEFHPNIFIDAGHPIEELEPRAPRIRKVRISPTKRPKSLPPSPPGP